MEHFFFLWQHIPEHLHPEIFSIGSFSLRWYSLMYIVALAVVYALTRWRIVREEISIPPDPSSLLDLVTWSVVGILVGGRLGYVLFYDFAYYAHHLLEVLIPFSFEKGFHFTGFSGMSFHGGVVGVLVVYVVLCRRRRWPLLAVTDALVPAIPLGYTFGRLGNFINGELYGRVTDWALGMVFPLDPLHALRFPSQLFEAFFEGLFLFAVLWPMRNKRPFPGFLSGAYLVGYGVIRFLVEFVRQPDPQLGFVVGPLSMGQVLCLAMVLGGLGLWAARGLAARKEGSDDGRSRGESA